jgi:hypothetical protein
MKYNQASTKTNDKGEFTQLLPLKPSGGQS